MYTMTVYLFRRLLRTQSVPRELLLHESRMPLSRQGPKRQTASAEDDSEQLRTAIYNYIM